jgi:hypothetical protein
MRIETFGDSEVLQIATGKLKAIWACMVSRRPM